eukprot:gene3000-3567_t
MAATEDKKDKPPKVEKAESEDSDGDGDEEDTDAESSILEVTEESKIPALEDQAKDLLKREMPEFDCAIKILHGLLMYKMGKAGGEDKVGVDNVSAVIDYADALFAKRRFKKDMAMADKPSAEDEQEDGAARPARHAVPCSVGSRRVLVPMASLLPTRPSLAMGRHPPPRAADMADLTEANYLWAVQIYTSHIDKLPQGSERKDPELALADLHMKIGDLAADSAFLKMVPHPDPCGFVAIDHYDTCMDLRNRHLPKTDTLRAAAPYEQAQLYLVVEDFAQAQSKLEDALQVYKDAGDPSNQDIVARLEEMIEECKSPPEQRTHDDMKALADLKAFLAGQAGQGPEPRPGHAEAAADAAGAGMPDGAPPPADCPVFSFSAPTAEPQAQPTSFPAQGTSFAAQPSSFVPMQQVDMSSISTMSVRKRAK